MRNSVEYRIDDLAREAETTTRNVRAYQERGLLPPPTLRGRVGIYGDDHLTRLKVIDSLLQRGFTSAHIADFLAGWEQGKDLGEVLGLQEIVTRRWSSEEPTTITGEQIVELLGEYDGDLVTRLVDANLIRISGDRCEILTPTLLEVFVDLKKYGFTLEQLLDLHEETSATMTAVAESMVGTVTRHLAVRHGPGWLPETGEVVETTEMLEKMRSLAMESAQAELARALDRVQERALGDYLSQTLSKRNDVV
ncbi:MerR family transcriptional regulator [Rhodococcus sp. IEGM 1354]|uniref:MerR family transcriptional regulator n=1 Tax=Rhodococcus sp. IEGM 1354 TaxID=3047088 RepID=UPI0024B6B24A|nr:MerR family transcriptional regulator [Rhodococcus sp. IEGM 1354]MDI9929594.1 MerR family transcriptional regulator [Rhodococcus sp. IEGM 1354]